MNRPYKIMLSIKSLEVRGGGAERVFVELSNHLVAQGWSVEVITLDHNQTSFYPLDPRVVFHALGLNQPGTPTPLLALLKFMVRNRILANRSRPHVYMSFMHSLYLPAQVSMLGSSAAFVASEHFRARYDHHPVLGRLVRWAARFHSLKTVPSHFVHRDFGSAEQKKAVVLPNPVDQRFFVERKSQAITFPIRRIICVGRLMLEKNHAELFEAISIVKNDLSGWVLDLYGDGVDRDYLQKRVSELGLQELVNFRGFSEELEKEYATSAFSVIPSLYESFGLAAAESLAAGCPVLAFDCCKGVAEFVDHGKNGLLVQAGENRVQNLAEAILQLVQGPQLRAKLESAARESVLVFQKESVMKKWASTLEQVANSRSG